MQANRNGRQAGRYPDQRARRGRDAKRSLAVALPMLLFASMAVIALFGLIAVVGVFALYSQGLEPASDLEQIVFSSPSVIYDRTGTVQLATFGGDENRQPVMYDQIPPILIDAQTAIEDKSFWTNTGVDPLGVLSAAFDTLRGDSRGASTITQQLVRQRLLDPALVADPSRTLERKIKEIIQSVRVTEAYPGTAGKQQIITAYFNQNYYGNGLYGVMAAAKGYFGVTSLDQLTLGQVALLAALPQSPSSYDLVRNAVQGPDGSLYVPLDQTIPIVARRDYILDLLANDPSRLILTGNKYSAQDFENAKNEPIVLAPQNTPQQQQQWLAPHFVWAVRDELAQKLCNGQDTCPALEAGGLKITTTLDWNMQQIAEKWVTAAVLLPHQVDPQAYAQQIGVPFEPWMKKLENLQVNNGAMIAMDYQTGETLAYVGSAGYYRNDLSSPQFQPQFDVLGDGWRQPGSTFKPFNYIVGLNNGSMTAASMFMDVTTTFDNSNGYTPKDWDLLERGPVRMRSALQWSMNIPAVKALVENGVNNVFQMAQNFGMSFQNDTPSAGLSLTLGTEVSHPRDVAVAYGTLANGGTHVGYTTILRVQDSTGTDVIPPYQPTGTSVVSPQAAYVMTNILASNTDPKQNPIWGDFAIHAADGSRRPAALKTGTTQDANDLVADGYLAPPTDAGRAAGEYALVVGDWFGNSDGSPVLTPQNPVLSTDVAAPTWQDFVQEVSQNWANNDFPVPNGIVNATVDAWSGGKPTQYTTQTYNEVFVSGTQPTADDPTKIGLQVVPDANGNETLWVDGCAGTPLMNGYLSLGNVEANHPDWHAADADWIARAMQGPGTAGGPDPQIKTKTSYIFDPRNTPYGKSWGAPFPPTTTCAQAPPSPSPSPSVIESPSLLPSPTFVVTPPPVTPPPVTQPPITPPPATPTEKPTPQPPTPPPVTEPPPPTPPPPTDTPAP